MTKSILCALVLWAYLGASGDAVASAGGSIRTSPITITLTDLDLADGISPSITFSLAIPAGSFTHYPRASFRWVDGETHVWEDLHAQGNEDLMLSWTIGEHISGDVAMTGRQSFATHQIAASTQVGHGSRLWSSGGAGSGWYDFVLSPNTGLVIEVTAELAGTISPAVDHYAHFSAGASLGMWIGKAGTNNEVYYGQSRNFTLDSTRGTATELSIEHLFRIEYENRSASPVDGFVELDAIAQSSVGALPTIPGIPEPGTLPTLALGLFIISIWARRP